MRTVSDVVGSHGGGIEYQSDSGVKITVMPLTLKIMSKYEKWLESKALATCMELKNLDAKLFREAFKATSDNIVKGAYAFGNELCQESLNTPAGIGKLVSLMCSIDEETALDIVMNGGEAFRNVLDLAIKQSLPSREEGSEGKAQTE